MMSVFGRSAPDLSQISDRMPDINPFSVNFTKWSNTLKQFVGNLPTNFLSVFDHFVGLALKGLCIILARLLQGFNQTSLLPQQLERYAAAVSDKVSPLKLCWGFIDGAVRPICRPGSNQRVLYNGHKRVYAIKFQSIAIPSGMIPNLYGLVEGKRHDSSMLAMSGLLPQFQLHASTPDGNPLCVYGDSAYPLSVQLRRPFKGNLNQQQKDYNQVISQGHSTVEWVFDLHF